ncbi:MAG: thioredoxin domain-containing protein [Desulfobacterales bacterium]|nr:thioredoxin domain-containing protein [Deltaproteobacteria bacterium]NNL75225.1 thioredoxin domain-containing protein [Desulfobacterales bacterium]
MPDVLAETIGTPTISKQSPSGKKVEYNRLIRESSPYLLQHATNPVNWFPWGDEAFETAKREDKPIFLSIGYSTCHWCHVMEHESFADQEVAALLNKHFISIKVDREERPDIDNVYMSVTQALTGSGGWPMTIIMTPDKKPFFAGTYFPKNNRWGRSGMMELLPKIAEAWLSEREKVLAGAERITQHVIGLNERLPGTDLDRKILDKAFTLLTEIHDSKNGGFGKSPKFPSPHQLSFLLRRYHHTQNLQPLEIAEKTLVKMRLGGIFDQVGFGFHRYSTDAQWLVPHFEKMLYDQSMLIMVYTEAYQATGKEFYARTAAEIITYVLREMTSAVGGFYSAEDADSEGIEGKFYLWTPQEIQDILGKKDAALINSIFNVKDGGNFQDAGPGHHINQNILHLQKTLPELAVDLGISEKKLRSRLEAGRKKLFRAREKRIHPFKDDKILTDWNGLMIAALAKAGSVLNNKTYIAAAAKASDFILQNLSDANGRLLKRYRKGKAGLPGHLNDYAFMVWGLLELYQAVFETKYLKSAIEINSDMLSHFWDEQNGGLYMTADDGEKLLVRSKVIYDGAIPSGNSVAMFNLLRLGHLTGKADYLTKAERIIKSFSASVKQYPAGFSQLMVALEFTLNPNYEVVVVGDPRKKDTASMLAALRKPFLPEKVVLYRPADQSAATDIIALAPFTRSMAAKKGQATAYVCQEFTCKLPTTSIDQMLKNLRQN